MIFITDMMLKKKMKFGYTKGVCRDVYGTKQDYIFLVDIVNEYHTDYVVLYRDNLINQKHTPDKFRNLQNIVPKCKVYNVYEQEVDLFYWLGVKLRYFWILFIS